MRKVKGKKIYSDPKLYTEAECRERAVHYITSEIWKLLDNFHAIAIMAYEDLETQVQTVRGEKFYKKDANAFNELFHKYVQDYCDGNFKKSDVKKYRNDALKGLLNECKYLQKNT